MASASVHVSRFLPWVPALLFLNDQLRLEHISPINPLLSKSLLVMVFIRTESGATGVWRTGLMATSKAGNRSLGRDGTSPGDSL